MTKYYYGAWHNFYHLSWPLRFFIELTLLAGFIWSLFRGIIKISRWIRIKEIGVKFIVFIVTELIHIFIRNKKQAYELDSRVVDWGERILKKEKKRNLFWAYIAICILGLVYMLAIFVDLPIAGYIQGYYIKEFAEIKETCMQYEKWLSKGYEAYPPLFVEVDSVESETTEAESEVSEKEDLLIRLNGDGRGGSYIREAPDLDAKEVTVVRDEEVIICKSEWEYDGERYWIKVYLPEDDLEGWLSGKLVEEEQLEEIIKE